MKTFIATLIIALSLFSVSVNATTTIYLGGWSHHFNDDWLVEHNESHELFVIEHKRLFVGRMINSFYTETFMAGIVYPIYRYSDIDVSIRGGLSYGYSYCPGGYKVNQYGVQYESRVCPMLGIDFKYTKFEYIKPAIIVNSSAAMLAIGIEF